MFNYETVIKGAPYIIAEIGSNHNGDMTLAFRLIDEAKKAGADCVKFQSWSKDTVFSRKTYDDNSLLLILFSVYSFLFPPVSLL